MPFVSHQSTESQSQFRRFASQVESRARRAARHNDGGRFHVDQHAHLRLPIAGLARQIGGDLLVVDANDHVCPPRQIHKPADLGPIDDFVGQKTLRTP